MTIEIHEPELEALIQRGMTMGRFSSVEEFLIQVLRSSSSHYDRQIEVCRKESLETMFAKARGLGNDLDTSRNTSIDRPVDLS